MSKAQAPITDRDPQRTTISKEGPPALDAEKTGRDQLLERFRLPPDMQADLQRSTLLIGTRGSGKTMFLRRCRHVHSGVALYGDLRKILNPITSDTGAGGLSFSVIPPSLEAAIQTKAVALLCLWLASEARARKVKIPWVQLKRALPQEIRPQEKRCSVGALERLDDAIRRTGLSELLRGSYLTPFIDFAAALHERCQESRGALLLLLDRAEEVPYPCLTPVLCLLDQIHSFMTVVAARPGILGPDQLLTSDTPIPGDHYDIRHLGSSPYSQEWSDFQMRVLTAWIPEAVSKVPEADLRYMSLLARDSIRHLLELVYNSIDNGASFSEQLMQRRAELLRETLLAAAQGKLRNLNGNLRGLLRNIRNAFDPMVLPILLELPSDPQQSISVPRPIREMTKQEKFIRLALRTGFLSLKDGVSWHPYRTIESLEISPLFIWQRGDQW